nr:uncharacterized protein LOC108086016 isoform X1 [Drosophila kikkawai]
MEIRNITCDFLKDLNEADLAFLFKNRRLGEKIRFRKKLLEWRKQTLLEWRKQTNTNTLDKGLDYSLDVNLPKSSENARDTIDLIEILCEHCSGEYVIRIFKEIQKLHDTSRKILIEATNIKK